MSASRHRHPRELGPSEIAGILASEDTEGDARVRKFDFYRPNKFSKEQLRTIELLHETFGRLASIPLSAALRAGVEFRVLAAEECTNGEFHETLGPDALVAVVQSPPLPGNSVLGLRSGFALTLVDRLLGGSGDPGAGEDADGAPRESTDIEIALLNRTVERMLGSLSEAWQAIAPLAFKLTGIEPSAQFAQAVAGAEMGMMLRLEMTVGEHSGEIFLLMPYLTLEPVLQKLSVQEYFSRRHQDARQERQDMHEELPRVPITLRAELGRVRLTYGAVRALRPGAVLRLGVESEAEIGIWTGSEQVFRARPGRSGRRSIVQITRPAGGESPRW